MTTADRVDPKRQRNRIVRTAFGVALIVAGIAVFLKAPEHAEKVALVLIGLGGIIIEPTLLMQVLRGVTGRDS